MIEKNRFGAFAALAFVVMGTATGCAAGQVRYLTANQWTTTPGNGSKVLYMTYYEGTCSSGIFGVGRGCKDGDSKLKRCTVAPDNTVACVDEAEASKALAKQ